MNLRTIRQVAAKEFRGYFFSPEAYAVLIVFLVLSGLYGFMMSHFIAADDASLAGFLDGHRYVYLILIPALGMQMWTDEQRTGMIEILFTLPVREIECVIGKFLAALGVVAVALALTFPGIATVCYLGSPDIGMIVTGYLGSLLLASAYIGICSLTSALSRNQVISYILGATVCLCLNLFGLQALSDVLTGRFEIVADFLAALGIRDHYAPFLRGIVDTRDLYYFIALTVFGLFGTMTVLWVRRSGGMGDMVSRIGKRLRGGKKELSAGAKRSLWLSGNGVLLFLWILLTLGVIFSFQHLRFDFTRDRMFTFNADSRAALEKIAAPVEIRFYVSRDRIARWTAMKGFAKRIEDLLTEYQTAMPDKVKIRKLDVKLNTPAYESAQVDGIQGVQVEGVGQVWLGIAVSSLDKRTVLPPLTPLTEPNLEYELTRAILQVTATAKPKVSILSSLPVGGHLRTDNPDANLPPWAFVRKLREYTDVVILPQSLDDIDPLETNALVVIQPHGLPQTTLYAIDQYLMRGGKILLFNDPNSFYTLLAEQHLGIPGLSKFLNADFGPLLDGWGIKFSPVRVAADMTLARVDPQSNQRMPCVLDITDPDCINTTHPATKHLHHLMFWISGFVFDPPPEGVTYTPLVSTTDDAAVVSAYTAQKHDDIRLRFKPEGGKRDLAAWYSGEFKTAYPTPPQGCIRPPGGHRTVAEKGAALVVVGDVDMLFETFNQNTADNPLDPGGKIPVAINDNIAFGLNLTDALAGYTPLIPLRGERHLRRPFTRLHKMRSQLEQKVVNSEKDLIKEVYDCEAALRRIRSSQTATQAELDIEQRRMDKLLEQLSDIDHFRYELAAIENRLFLFNVTAVPLVVLVFGTAFLSIVNYRRRAR